MSIIERQVKKARHRLWLNRWLRQWGWSVLFAAAAWTLAWLVDRLFFPGFLPKGAAALAGLGASLVVSFVWLGLTREPSLAAAAALDEAAGLRERVATGLHVQPKAEEPFAGAVVADAERAVAGLSARRFIPIRWAGSMSLGTAMIATAVLSLLLPEIDLLGGREAMAAEEERLASIARVRSVVATPEAVMREIKKRHPNLDKDERGRRSDDPLRKDLEINPDVLRRETVKKLDRLQDALNQKANSDRFKALKETKKRLKQLGSSSDPKTELGMLTEALSEGNFQQAQAAVKKLQEKLAQRARDGKLDTKAAAQMRKQLDELAQKLQKAAQDKQSARELQNAGLSKADAQRVLEALSKKDPQQLEKLAKDLAKRLKDQGMTEQQIKDMLEKIQQRRQACKQCNKLGQKMAGAAKQMQQGSTQAAQTELAEAGEMLTEMEQMEQGLNELEAQMAQLNDARDGLNEEDRDGSGECKQCNGTGFRPDGSPCPGCNGTGQRGGIGGGGGVRARNDNAKTDTVGKKANIKTRRGTIIGQKFVKGQLLKGSSEVALHDAAAAAEIETTDALNRDKIPRKYRKGVKRYFDRLSDRFRASEKAEDTKKPAGSGEPAAGEKESGAAAESKQPDK